MYFQTSVGINIENDRVTLVYLQASLKGLCLAAHAAYPLVAGTPEERTGEIKRYAGEFLREHRVSSADIFLAIPRDLAILRYAELPLAAKENLRGALLYEMEKYVPLPVDAIYFDFQIIAEDKEANKLLILLLVVKREWVDPYLGEGLFSAGVSGVEIGSTALVNYLSFRRTAPNGDAYGIVRCEKDHVESSFVRKRLLQYSRSVKIDAAEGSRRRVLMEEVDRLRNAAGPEQGPLEVVLCGSEAAGASELLKDRDDIVLRPVDLAPTGIPADLLAPAYGLALKGIQKVPLDVNVLPAGLRKKVSKIPYYALFALAGLFILSLLAWGGSTIIHQRRVADRLGGEIKQLSAEVAAVNKAQEKLKALEQRVDSLNALRQRHLPAVSILRDLTKELPPGAWLDRLNVTDKGGDIEGYADSASALIPLLANSPLLKDVAFLAPITKGKDGKERFRIGFKVR